MADVERHIAGVKKRLGHLAALGEKARVTGDRIRKAAADRREIVESDLHSLRPRVETSPDAAQRYQDLMLEMGQLDMVLAQG